MVRSDRVEATTEGSAKLLKTIERKGSLQPKFERRMFGLRLLALLKGDSSYRICEAKRVSLCGQKTASKTLLKMSCMNLQIFCSPRVS